MSEEILRDRYGNRRGAIVTESNGKQVAKDRYGTSLANTIRAATPPETDTEINWAKEISSQALSKCSERKRAPVRNAPSGQPGHCRQTRGRMEANGDAGVR